MFGLTDRGAQSFEIEERGETKITRIFARGITKRAAVRAARQEASELIPLHQQDVLNVTFDRKLGPLQSRYLVVISHNRPGVDRGY